MTVVRKKETGGFLNCLYQDLEQEYTDIDRDGFRCVFIIFILILGMIGYI